jgi:hypothetical protein
MGSKRRDSSRPSKAGTPKSIKSRAKLPASKPGRKPTDFDALLERFSDALSFVATATYSLTHSRDELQTVSGHDVGDDIFTLEHGLIALRAVFDELDVGIREVRS